MTQAAGDAPHHGARDPRAGGRVLRGGLLAAAVAAVVALDAGVVALPGSTPKPFVRPTAAGSTSPAVSLVDAKTRESAVRATLVSAGAALADGDAAAVAGLVEPGRKTTRTLLQTMATNFRAMKTTDVAIEWNGSWMPPSSGSEADSIVAHAVLRTWVRHYDKAPGSELVDIGMQRSGDRWLVTTWQWEVAENPPPWAVPGLVTIAKPHVMLLGQAKNAAVNRRLASRAEAALVDAAKIWRVPGWNRTAVVVAVADEDYLGAWFGAGMAGPGDEHADWFNTAVTSTQESTEAAAGFRVVLGTDFLLRDTRKTRSDLRFAFTLLAFDATWSYRLPGWLYYGSADYTAWRAQGPTDGLETLRSRGLQDRTWTALRNGTWKPQFTDRQDLFAEGSTAKVDNDWDTAFLTVTYIADRYGEDTLRALVNDIDAGTLTHVALRKHLHLDHDKLAAEVRAYARALAAKA